MTTSPIPIAALLDRLSSGPWRVVGLPTMRGPGLSLFHHEGAFYWTQLTVAGDTATGCQRFEPEQARDFLARYTRPEGYPAELLVPWGSQDHPAPEAMRAAASRAWALFQALEQSPGRALRVMGSWWVWRSPWFGHVWVTLTEDRPPYVSCPDDDRVMAEIFSALLKAPEHDFEDPPEEVAAFRDDFRARASAHFAQHGPTHQRVLLTSDGGDERRGFVRNARGALGEVILQGAGEAARLISYTRSPEAKAHERIFDGFKRDTLAGSVAVTPALAEALAGVEDVPTVLDWLDRREVVVSCGEFRPGGWISDSPTTLLDTFKGDILPFEEAVAPFMGRSGYYQVRFEALVPLSDQARAQDDPQAPSVRYTIPRGWAYRFDRERLLEAALVATWREATGHQGELPRCEERSEREDPQDPRAAVITVDFGDPRAGLTLTLDPIESGHGVHGERLSAVFRGLPEGVGIVASGRLDMRAGGELHLDFRAPAEVAMALKRACLGALP